MPEKDKLLASSFEPVTKALPATLASATIGNLTATTYYRAVVTSGVCSSATSNTVIVTVTPNTAITSQSTAAQTQCIGGTFTASPVLVGPYLFAVDESGKTTIFKASPTAFEAVGENQLGDESYASPAAVGDRLFVRVATSVSGSRQEYLYCLGEKK